MKFCLRILSLLLLVAPTLTDLGFNLEDAFDPTDKPQEQPETPKKVPTPAPKKPSSGDSGGFDLEDALKPDSPTKSPDKSVDKRPSGGGGGSFDDSDLFGVSNDDSYKPDKGSSGGRAVNPGYDSQGDADQPKEGSVSIAGILSAVGVALVGAASGYFSYQKKKLCFKERGAAEGRTNDQVV